jgi:hypothetical protein
VEIPATSDNIPGTLVLRDNTGGFALKPGSIVNADISASAAIAGTKIAPDFGSQNITIGDKIIHSGDTNTAIRFPSNDTVTVETSGSEWFRVDPTGKVYLRSSADYSPSGTSFRLQVHQVGSSNEAISAFNWSTASAAVGGRLSLLRANANTQGTYTACTSAAQYGQIDFWGSDGSKFVQAATIVAYPDGTPGADDMPCRLVFFTTASGSNTPTERMRINSSGSVLIGTTSTSNSEVFNVTQSSSDTAITVQNPASGPARTAVTFRNGTTNVGTITTTAAATSFNTSSDYRLKQNVEPMSQGLQKLNSLSPKTFEFKTEPGVKVDGFIAHEVQAVVPQAVTGEKDGEEMQGLDMSKLVPVLVAAVQELAAKVEALEAELQLK